ncbi:ABC transporter permease [Pseudofrankia inefficax]|uniref:Binding-protein-dependent transport systems inner membrane component n=1 Tax=Pseudofrankia inefficax (strain DSM 45817 / CECT 9037 / DDB 130130 / EuI1c) TaxID=298654 RepID=E3J3Q9_PSEI1|nr:ABC transporter permease [Pseudofrankia inefficax]ADP79396.1 binding-protein-dependent transport systems inner membrane component [Pseudofrankia inefficax]
MVVAETSLGRAVEPANLADRAAAAGQPARGHPARRLLRRLSFTLSAAVVAFWVIMAVAWRWLGVRPFVAAGTPLRGPGWSHLFGTDNLGRDVLARVLAGAEPVIAVAPAATAMAALAGTAVGLAAGWYRGLTDELVMRACDVLTVFPGIITLILIVSAFGHSVLTIMLAITVFLTPLIARTVRAMVLVERETQYVEAARLQGERGLWIMFREILPNITPTIVIDASVRLGHAIFIDAGLSFLGLGAQPPSPDWGLAVTQNLTLLQNAWWTVAFPACAIGSLVAAVNLVADNLREVLEQ